MEYVEKNRAAERDLPPALFGGQGMTRQESRPPVNHDDNACPWSSHCTDGWGLSEHPLAMVYAPCQGFHSLYDPETALQRGTLFSELDLPLEVVSDRGVTACSGCQRASQNRYR